MITAYKLYVRSPNGSVTAMTFTSAFLRGLAMIPLVRQPVDLRVEDLEAAS